MDFHSNLEMDIPEYERRMRSARSKFIQDSIEFLLPEVVFTMEIANFLVVKATNAVIFFVLNDWLGDVEAIKSRHSWNLNSSPTDLFSGCS